MIYDYFEKYKSNFNLSKDWLFPYAEVNKGAKIILYGAGDVGQSYYEQITMTSYCTIVSWVDANYRQYQEYGLPVNSNDCLVDLCFDYVVIAVFKYEYACEIYDFLLNEGVDKKKIVWGVFPQKRVKGSISDSRLKEPTLNKLHEICERRGLKADCEQASPVLEMIDAINDGDRLVLPRLVIQVTTACNLKCKGCNNLIPLMNKAQHLPASAVISDLNKILRTVDYVLTIEVIGGEPFLYPELEELLNYLIKQSNVIEIELTTNGTIIPKVSVIDRLSNSKVRIIISNYKHKNQQLVEKEFFLRGVRYEVRYDDFWMDSGDASNRGKSVKERQKDYIGCIVGQTCKTLFNGKLYQCPRAASLNLIGIIKEEDFLNLRNESLSKDDIKNFWISNDCLACNYCDYSDDWRMIPYPSYEKNE